MTGIIRRKTKGHYTGKCDNGQQLNEGHDCASADFSGMLRKLVAIFNRDA